MAVERVVGADRDRAGAVVDRDLEQRRELLGCRDGAGFGVDRRPDPDLLGRRYLDPDVAGEILERDGASRARAEGAIDLAGGFGGEGGRPRGERGEREEREAKRDSGHGVVSGR
jgi:hypothetical protein